MDGPTIMMVDEVLPMTGSADKKSGETVIYDWSSLNLSPKVDVIMALSPAPTSIIGSDQFQVIPPSQTIMFTQQLLQKYRNFAELDRLLSCIKYHQEVLSTTGE